MKLETKLALDYYVGGLLHVLLKPLVYITGKIIPRHHGFDRIKSVTVFKLLGGGSVVIAYPALLGIKRARPDCRLTLVATQSTKVYAEELGIFDRIIRIDDSSLMKLLRTTFFAVLKLFRCDCIVDMEVHSRLSAIFTLATCARNRIGYYTETGLWRRYIYTHLLFFNNQTGVYNFYDQLAQLFGGMPFTLKESIARFRDNLGLGERLAVSEKKLPGHGQIAIAPCCSGLGRTRMFEAADWGVLLLESRKKWTEHPTVHLLGGAQDFEYCSALERSLAVQFSGEWAVTVANQAGRRTMRETLLQLEKMDILYCVDSGVLHFARLLGLPTVSYWGPTAPQTRLKDVDSGNDIVHYAGLPCSPCVHMADYAPCLGNNVCMKKHILKNAGLPSNPAWLDRSSAKIQ